MIYSPCYHGKHNVLNYNKMKKDFEFEIKTFWSKNTETLDIYLDAIFDSEVKHWFYQIFFDVFRRHEKQNIIFRFWHKDKKVLRKARQYLRALRYNYSDIKQSHGRYFIIMEHNG